MAISLTALSGTHDASTLRARLTTIEEYLNGGIVAGDLSTSAWVKSQHIFRPELRFPQWSRMVTADTHWRAAPVRRQHRSLHHALQVGDEWQPIRGAAMTLKVPEDSLDVFILCSLYAWNVSAGNHTANAGSTEQTGSEAADIQLFVNGSASAGTLREVFFGGDFSHAARKQLTFAKQVSLNQGEHDIQVKIRLNSASYIPTSTWKRMYVDCRYMVVDVAVR